MAGRFSIEGVFKALDSFTAPVRKMTSQLEKMQSAASKRLSAIDERNGKVARGIAKVGVAAAAGAAVAGAALYDVVQSGAEFEHTIVGAAAKFDPAIRRGTEMFERLKKGALDVGSASEFGAQKAAGALDSLAAAGMKPEQALALLPGTIDLATSATVELGDASEMATKALGAFNLVTDDTAQLTANFNRITDNMAKTANITNANMAALFETIKEGGPIAVTAGQSVETFHAISGQLANVGIEGTVAGTTMKNMFLILAAPPKEAAAALAQLGVKTRDANGNMLDALEILTQLQNKTAKMGTAKKAATLEGIFGKIPLAGVSALLSGGIDKVKDLRTQLEAAAGYNKQIAGIMRDDTKGALDKAAAAFEGVKLAMAEVVTGPLMPLVKGFSDWANANKDAIASDMTAFLKEAVPWVKSFATGLKDGAAVVAEFGEKASFVITPLQALFGDSSQERIANAHTLGKVIVEGTAAFFAFAAVTKAARVATFTFGVVTNGVKAIVWAYEAAVTGIRAAIVLYQIASKAGVGATIAMSFASKAATADLVAQRAAAMAAAGSFSTLALAGGVAALAIGAAATAWAVWSSRKEDAQRIGQDAENSVLQNYGAAATVGPFGPAMPFAPGAPIAPAPAAKKAEQTEKKAAPSPAAGAPQAQGESLEKLLEKFSSGGAAPNDTELAGLLAAMERINAKSLGGDHEPTPTAPPSSDAPATASPQPVSGGQVSRDQGALLEQQTQLAELIKVLKDNAKQGAEITIKTDDGVDAEVTKPAKGMKLSLTRSGV